MEHFLKENAAIPLHCKFYSLFFSRTTKTFISFLISYTTLEYTNMKGVKRKAEQPTLAVFGVTKKIIHNGEMILSYLFIYFLVYKMCSVVFIIRLCLTFRVFFTLIMLISVLLIIIFFSVIGCKKMTDDLLLCCICK